MQCAVVEDGFDGSWCLNAGGWWLVPRCGWLVTDGVKRDACCVIVEHAIEFLPERAIEADVERVGRDGPNQGLHGGQLLAVEGLGLAIRKVARHGARHVLHSLHEHGRGLGDVEGLGAVVR
jgi:hypothetical protein